MIKPSDFLTDLKPYQLATSLGQIEVRGAKNALKLDWNESTIPPSPKVLRAIRRELKRPMYLAWYAKPIPQRLYTKLKEIHGLPSSKSVLVTNGSDAGLELILRSFINPSDPILLVQPSYSQFKVLAKSLSHVVVDYILPDPFNPDPKLIVDQAKTVKAKLLYLVNPNNPTGALIERENLEFILENLPDTLVLVDEAYADFANVTAIPLVEKYPNMVISRTMSKAFGLAGFRLGYLIASEPLINIMTKIHNFKSVNRLAFVAAEAALGDERYTERFIGLVNRAKALLYQELPVRGIKVYGSWANFVLIETPRIKELFSYLQGQNIYIRDLNFVAGMPKNTARITIGTPKQMKRFIKVVDRFHTRSSAKAAKQSILSKIIGSVRNRLGERPDIVSREWSKSELTDYQKHLFRELIKFVSSHNKFYRELWQKEGILIDEIRTIDDIRKLPIVTKGMFRAADKSGSWFSEGYDKSQLLPGETTGSSGEPFTVYHSREEQAHLQQLFERSSMWWKQTLADRYALFWREKHFSQSEETRARLGLYKKFNILDVNDPHGSSLDQSVMAKTIAELEKFNPEIIRGYASALWFIAQYMLEQGIDSIRPRAIIAAAEALSESVEETITKAFKTKVFNLYGSTEAPFIALTCPDSNYLHVMSDQYIVEVVNDQGEPCRPGEIGQIVITDLHLRSAPLIRYPIGDLAKLPKQSCPCGRALPSLERVIGRTNDLFTLPNGERIISHLWYIYFRDHREIRQFQVIQEASDTIRIKYILAPGANPTKVVALLNKKLQKLLWGITLIWERVELFERGRGGKFQAIISKVPNQFNLLNQK